jgi:hypothetical protein
VQCQPRSRAAASGFWLPPTGPIKDSHLRSFIHAQRTFGYASATAQGWSIRVGIPNLKTGTALGGRSGYGTGESPMILHRMQAAVRSCVRFYPPSPRSRIASSEHDCEDHDHLTFNTVVDDVGKAAHAKGSCEQLRRRPLMGGNPPPEFRPLFGRNFDGRDRRHAAPPRLDHPQTSLNRQGLG